MRLRRVLLAALAVAAVPLTPLGVAVRTAAPASATAPHAPGVADRADPDADDEVATASSHTCTLRRGSVRCWGKNSVGQLGLGDTQDRGAVTGEAPDLLPAVSLGTGRGAIGLAARGHSTCAILDDGTVKCWGYNATGQLGLGDTAARGDGANEMGDHLPPVDLGTGRTARALSAGTFHMCAILDNGSVKCWGDNDYGQLGLGDNAARGDDANEMGDHLPTVNLGTGRTARAISAGGHHTCAILDNGTTKCWGSNFFGELGLGDSDIRGDDANEMGDDLPTVNLGTGHAARRVALGDYGTCALLETSAVACWGNNSHGELGAGDQGDRGDQPGEMGDNLPAVDLGTGRTARDLAVGSQHRCVILDDGTLKCWGNNSFGQLGLGDTANRGDAANEMGDHLPTVDLGTGRTVRHLTIGIATSCAVLDDGTLKCWGDNEFGQLGLGDTADRGDGPNEMGDHLPVIDEPGNGVAEIVVGTYHMCARLETGRVKCWGISNTGQLGLGSLDDFGDGAGEMGDTLPFVDLGTGRTARQLAAGSYHTCAILDDGRVKCWGWNVNGQLGLGDTVDRGDQPGEMGDNLPAVDLGTGRTARQITVGTWHTCALLDDSSVKCWGAGGFGKLGLGDQTNRGDGAGEMGDALPAVAFGTGRHALSVQAGHEHTCALLDDGTITCWGRNSDGQLGLGTTSAARAATAGEMGDNLLTVNLGTGRTARSVVTGDDHTCAILDNGLSKCWGMNYFGQLGLGDANSRGSRSSHMGDNLPTIDLGTGRTARVLAADASDTCAILDDGATTCWGRNFRGEHGVGDAVQRGDGAGEMGDALPATSFGTSRHARSLALGAWIMCAVLDDGSSKCFGRRLSGVASTVDTTGYLGDEPGEIGDAMPPVELVTPPTIALLAPLTPDPVRSTHFVVEADESISGATADDFFTTGTAEACTHSLTASGGTGFSVLVDCLSDGTVTLHLRRDRVVDASGNRGPAQIVSSAEVTLLDEVPTATWSAPDSPTEARSLNYTLTMSETVDGLGPNDIVVRGTAPGCVATMPWTDGRNAMVSVNCTGQGTVLVSLLASSVTDHVGHLGPLHEHRAPSVVIGPPRTISPVTPMRLLDTRSGIGGVPRARLSGTTGALAPLTYHVTGRAGVPSNGAAAVSLNLTVVDPATDGYATVYPCGTVPDTSSVNFTAGRTTANAAVTPLSAGGDFCIVVFGDAHVIADVTGWYATGKGFNAVAPARLYDTRTGTGGVPRARVAGRTGAFTPLVFHAAGRNGVPANGAAAVSLNLTVVEPTTDGYATVYPCGTIPDTSSVNFTAGNTTANAVTTPLSTGGDFCVIVFGDAHVIADVNGWYAGDAGFSPVTPSRLLDTRTGLGGVAVGRIGSPTGTLTPLTFHVAGRGGVPSSGAAAVSVNVTVVEPTTDGYATVYPCGTIPDTSTVNFAAGRTTANAATTPISAGGDFCVIVRGDAHIIVDINGWYA